MLTWMFIDGYGYGAGLLGVTPAPLKVGIVVLMASLVFGLSTDYEVFLLSQVVEARAQGASTEDSVRIGLARTGRVITAAALLLIVVTGALAFSGITVMRFVGVGMILALVLDATLLDATLVRMVLVPAVLKLMGNAAWWAPGRLQRVGAEESVVPTGERERERVWVVSSDVADETEVLVYTRPGCPFCTSLRAGLRRHGVEFREVDIWQEQEAAAVVRSIADGNETVPTVVVGEWSAVNPGTGEVVTAVAERAPDRLPESKPGVVRGALDALGLRRTEK